MSTYCIYKPVGATDLQFTPCLDPSQIDLQLELPVPYDADPWFDGGCNGTDFGDPAIHTLYFTKYINGDVYISLENETRFNPQFMMKKGDPTLYRLWAKQECFDFDNTLGQCKEPIDTVYTLVKETGNFLPAFHGGGTTPIDADFMQCYRYEQSPQLAGEYRNMVEPFFAGIRALHPDKFP